MFDNNAIATNMHTVGSEVPFFLGYEIVQPGRILFTIWRNVLLPSPGTAYNKQAVSVNFYNTTRLQIPDHCNI
jgi:hypothetical protein